MKNFLGLTSFFLALSFTTNLFVKAGPGKSEIPQCIRKYTKKTQISAAALINFFLQTYGANNIHEKITQF